jgi:hypothetical protein
MLTTDLCVVLQAKKDRAVSSQGSKASYLDIVYIFFKEDRKKHLHLYSTST